MFSKTFLSQKIISYSNFFHFILKIRIHAKINEINVNKK
jgi:hypothetical protein